MRARITDRFAELHHQREQTQAQLDALHAAVPQAADTTLLDELPLLEEDLLPGMDSAAKAKLFDAFDLQVLWNKTAGQATVWIEITDATSAPSPPSSTPTKTATMTLPAPLRLRLPMWRICSKPLSMPGSSAKDGSATQMGCMGSMRLTGRGSAG